MDRKILCAQGASEGLPLYVYDAESLRGRARTIRSLLPAGIAELFYFEPANRAAAILDLFRENGFGVAVVSRRGVRACLGGAVCAGGNPVVGLWLFESDLDFAAGVASKST